MSNEEYKTLSLECIRIEQEVYEQRIFQESKFPNQVLPYVWDNGRPDGGRGSPIRASRDRRRPG